VRYLPEGQLANRFLRATGWIVSEHGIGQMLRFAGNLVLTRLLAPDMFGVMAIAHVVISGMTMFSDIGLELNVIRSKRGNDPVFLDTVWTIQILRGLLLFLVTLCCSLGLYWLSSRDFWPSDSVYQNTELPIIISLLALSPLIDGFKSTNLATANRNLNMSGVAIIQIASQASGTLLMIVWAYFDPSVYALVAGGILARCIHVFTSHCIIKGHKNRIQWDPKAFEEIFGFGKWIFVTSILGFMVLNGDKLILGALIDPNTLGLYSLAGSLIAILFGTSNKVVGKVGYAVISEIDRDSPQRIKEIYYRIRFPLDGCLLFISGLFFFIGSELVEFLYDERYAYAGHIIEVLSLALIVERYMLFSKVLTALGRPNLNVYINLIGVVCLYIGLPWAYTMYDFEGALWFIAFYKVSTFPLIFYYKYHLNLLDVKQEFRVLPFFIVGMSLGYLFTAALNL